ncbi:hypothetical protein JTE90_027497 [Oedothorax gibbosus]|uniref:Uncharacterized protein n=1 Tax=Oedothorax gibbosus TaxID=931172 RepID=A0AAV6TTN1_9ARAC|nr:hypothetical protein JTE90_027497 [Oedothorax gibbosus]
MHLNVTPEILTGAGQTTFLITLDSKTNTKQTHQLIRAPLKPKPPTPAPPHQTSGPIGIVQAPLSEEKKTIAELLKVVENLTKQV